MNYADRLSYSFGCCAVNSCVLKCNFGMFWRIILHKRFGILTGPEQSMVER